MMAAMGGSSIIYGIGMLELGITLTYGQIIIDAEVTRMIRRILQGMAVNEDTLAYEVIKAVGAGGNYLEQMHTMQHMRQEQSRSKVIDRLMRGPWEEKGSKDMKERADEEARRIFENHHPEQLDAGIAKQLRAIIEEAESEE